MVRKGGEGCVAEGEREGGGEVVRLVEGEEDEVEEGGG